MRANVDLARKFAAITKKDSFIAQEHAMILDKFTDIVSGEYISGMNHSIFFKPISNGTTLTTAESSCVIRSMLDASFYLRHIVKPGDLLIIDEPELYLHPENQPYMIALKICSKLVLHPIKGLSSKSYCGVVEHSIDSYSHKLLIMDFDYPSS